MSAPMHTPGPWRVWEDDEGMLGVVSPNGSFITCLFPTEVCIDGGLTPENARLIAAAPELLETLEEVSWQLSADEEAGEPSFMPKVRAAIAKARGDA